jgi:protein-L-isoaspartate(D-aspartate) O-methyltransferase
MITNTKLARKSMLQGQIFTNQVTDGRVLDALKTVPREDFVAEKYKNVAYIDDDIPLGGGRYLPQPLVFARMLQLAEIEKSHRVLDIASGTGYSAAVIALLAKEVIALEADSELTASASVNLNKLDVENVNLVAGDLLMGAPEYKLYDVIMIEGTVEYIPETILKQLKPGGRLVTVLAKEKLGNIVVVHKGEKISTTATHFQATTQRLEEFAKPKGFSF